MKESIKLIQYDRTQNSSGIMHIGVGNFHRAHQAFYIHQLLNEQSHKQWAICGTYLLPQDEKIYKKLKSQNGIYTLTVCGRDGKDEVYEIGSLNELLWAIEKPDAVLNKIADKDIKIITLTITEGGYNIDNCVWNSDFCNY